MPFIRRLALFALCVACLPVGAGAFPEGKRDAKAKGGEAPEEGSEAPSIESRLLFRAASVHLGDGRVLSPGEVLVEDGKIVAVAARISEDAWAEGPEPENRDLGDQILTPGLIDAWTTVPSSSGSHPEYQVADVVDPFDPLLESLLQAGVTAALIVPAGGSEAGVAVVVRVREDGLEILSASAGLVLELDAPSADGRAAATLNVRRKLEKAEAYAQKWKDYREALEEAGSKKKRRKDGEEEPKRPGHNAAREVWASVATGDLPVLAVARHAGSALQLQELFSARSLPATFVGCAECDGGTAPLRTHIILLPLRSYAPGADRRPPSPDLAVRLADAEGRIAAGTGGPWPASALWVLTAAASLVSQGLTAEDALAAVTGRAAVALGIADRVGLLAPGRSADLVAWSGPPLDPASEVRSVYLEGALVAWGQASGGNLE